MNYQIKRALVTTGVVLIIAILGLVIGLSIQRTSKAMDIAKSNGCEYLGSARDLSSVSFFECDGKIEMRRIK